MPPSPAEPDTCVLKNIRHCARCGGDHDGELVARPFTQPFAPPEAGGIAWSHWLPCPTNGEPILVRIAEEPFDEFVRGRLVGYNAGGLQDAIDAERKAELDARDGNRNSACSCAEQTGCSVGVIDGRCTFCGGRVDVGPAE